MMAVVGSEVGGAITYWLAKKAGQEEMQKRLGKRRVEKLHRFIERWGFGAVAVPAMLPPPFPLAPFLIFSGATQYSVSKYLAALATGRVVKYTLLAFLASRYGRRIFSPVGRYEPILIALVIAALIGIALLAYWAYKKTPHSEHTARSATEHKSGRRAP